LTCERDAIHYVCSDRTPEESAMQSPTFSDRENRIKVMDTEAYRRACLADLRLANANRGLAYISQTGPSGLTTSLARQEADEARTALDEARARRAKILAAKDRHTRNLPDGSIVIVMDRDGMQYVIERDDSRDTGFVREYGAWYRLNSDEPMTFDEAIGVDEDYNGHEFFRLYTQEQVDDLMDEHQVGDLQFLG
jgi:hypothetical protein